MTRSLLPTAPVLGLALLVALGLPGCGEPAAAHEPAHAHAPGAHDGDDDDIVVETRTDMAPILALQGRDAPALQVTEWVHGEPTTLEALRGKVVLLDFWGTWCPPCRALTPSLKELAETHADDGLVVIGVHTARGGPTAAAYAAEHELPYAVAVDGDEDTVAAYHVNGYPDLYLIGRDGKVAYADLKQSPFENVEAAVRRLLARP